MNGPSWKALLVTLIVGIPATVSAQGVGVGVKAGTAGVGGDLGLGLGSRAVLRAGLGYFPVNYEFEADDTDYELSVPGVNGTLGLDLQLLGPLRLMGGLFYKSDAIRGSAPVGPGDEIGDLVLDQAGTVFADLDLGGAAPYVGIGFGKLAGGFGLYLDLAVAFMGEPDLVLSASDNLNAISGFAVELEKERQDVLDDVPETIYYPIVQLGLKFGLGD